MRIVYSFSAALLLFCFGCQWQLKPFAEDAEEMHVVVERFDRIESLYLTTGDFSALQQMSIGYPQQTRMLIEDVLCIGQVNEPDINVKFLNFFQDTTLRALIHATQQQYANMDDVSKNLDDAFRRLRHFLPEITLPQVYAQIGSLDQSVVVGDGMIGISLDKYLGEDYPLYQRPEYGYTEQQRKLMSRQYIVPDCIGFFILSLYPMKESVSTRQTAHDRYVGKVQWIVNRCMRKSVFNTVYTRTVSRYMKQHPDTTIEQLLRSNSI
jgi:hypothetical protein